MNKNKFIKIISLFLILIQAIAVTNGSILIPHYETDYINGNLYYNCADTHGWYGCSIANLVVHIDYTDPDNRELYVTIYETPPDDDDDKTTLWSGYLEEGESSATVELTEHYHLWVVVENNLYAEWEYYEGRVVTLEY